MINPFQRIGRDWMLVTAGTEEEGVNTLTACWGGLGDLWHKDAAFILSAQAVTHMNLLKKMKLSH